MNKQILYKKYIRNNLLKNIVIVIMITLFINIALLVYVLVMIPVQAKNTEMHNKQEQYMNTQVNKGIEYIYLYKNDNKYIWKNNTLYINNDKNDYDLYNDNDTLKYLMEDIIPNLKETTKDDAITKDFYMVIDGKYMVCNKLIKQKIDYIFN